MNKNIILTSVVAVVVGVAAFFGGIHYQKSKIDPLVAGQIGQYGSRTNGGTRSPFMGMRGGGTVLGSVIAKDDKSITVQTQGGGSKIVFLSATTSVSTAAKGTLADVGTGSDIVIMGTPNADGSVTATTIELRPKQ